MLHADTHEFFQILIEEIQVDPAGKGYKTQQICWKDDATIWGLLTEEDTEVTSLLDVGDMVKYLADSGKYDDIVDDSNALLSSTRSVSLATLKFTDNPELQVDFGDPDIVGMLDALVSNSVITSTNKDDVLELATKNRNRLYFLGLDSRTTVAAVEIARQIYEADPDTWMFGVSASGSASISCPAV